MNEPIDIAKDTVLETTEASTEEARAILKVKNERSESFNGGSRFSALRSRISDAKLSKPT